MTMIPVPAVGLGLLVVFFAGSFLTYGVVSSIGWIAKKARVTRRRPPPAPHWEVVQDSVPQGKRQERWKWTEGTTAGVCVVGGIGAVVLMVLALVSLSTEWAIGLWAGLTLLGFIAGFLTFVAAAR